MYVGSKMLGEFSGKNRLRRCEQECTVRWRAAEPGRPTHSVGIVALRPWVGFLRGAAEKGAAQQTCLELFTGINSPHSKETSSSPCCVCGLRSVRHARAHAHSRAGGSARAHRLHGVRRLGWPSPSARGATVHDRRHRRVVTGAVHLWPVPHRFSGAGEELRRVLLATTLRR